MTDKGGQPNGSRGACRYGAVVSGYFKMCYNGIGWLFKWQRGALTILALFHMVEGGQ